MSIVFSIVPMKTGMYRATALVAGAEHMTFGFSHTDALNRLFAVLSVRLRVW